MNTERQRITDISFEELKRDMAEYGRRQSSSVRSSRKFLRSLGIKIDKKGVIMS